MNEIIKLKKIIELKRRLFQKLIKNNDGFSFNKITLDWLTG